MLRRPRTPADPKDGMDCATFSVSEDIHQGLVRLRPAGELDLVTAPLVRRRLDELHQDRIGTVLDLSDLSFMGSEGIHILAAAQQASSRDGWRFSARNPSPHAELTLRACGMRALTSR